MNEREPGPIWGGWWMWEPPAAVTKETEAGAKKQNSKNEWRSCKRKIRHATEPDCSSWQVCYQCRFCGADIHELNERRAAAEMRMRALGMMNTPINAEDQLKLNAQFRLANDALWQANKEYQDAINELSAEELMTLAGHRKARGE